MKEKKVKVILSEPFIKKIDELIILLKEAHEINLKLNKLGINLIVDKYSNLKTD